MPSTWTEHHFDSIGSTMDAARDLAINGATDRTVIRADLQVGGRGRYGRVWTSEPGNLYMTVILRETKPLSECAQLSFAAALSLSSALDMWGVTLKWPNDVLIKGKKVAGILLESGGPIDGPWILIGMGVNVAHHPDDALYSATNLMAEGESVSPDTLCHRVLECIDHWRGVWHKQGASALHEAWLALAHGRGEAIRVRLVDRGITGIFETLDTDGNLVVRDDTGIAHKISAGDVFF